VTLGKRYSGDAFGIEDMGAIVIHIKLHSTESGQFCKERVPDGLAV